MAKGTVGLTASVLVALLLVGCTSEPEHVDEGEEDSDTTSFTEVFNQPSRVGGVGIIKDRETNCQYIANLSNTGAISITPRLNSEGKPMCGNPTKEE